MTAFKTAQAGDVLVGYMLDSTPLQAVSRKSVANAVSPMVRFHAITGCQQKSAARAVSSVIPSETRQGTQGTWQHRGSSHRQAES